MVATIDSDRQKRLSSLLNIVQMKKQQEQVDTTMIDTTNDLQEPATPTKTAIKKVRSVASSPKARATAKATLPPSILPNFYYNTDRSCSLLEMPLREEVEIRPYQQEALEAIVNTTSTDPSQHYARSGIIVLPCGAGKTLTSILVASAIQKPVLVVCSTIIAAEQFNKEFLRFTHMMASRTGMFAGAKKWPYNGPSGVLFTSYTMLVDSNNRTAESKKMSKFINEREWGLIILDEVHCVPANNFAKAILKIRAKVRLGLTATMLREDDRIGDLENLVGPTLYHAKWKELADRGYIAKVICTQVESEMSPNVKQAHDRIKTTGGVLGHGNHLKTLLSILNPKKIQICQRLIQYHEAKGDKVLVFCDHIDALKIYAEKIGRPFIYGGTSVEDARALLGKFQIEASGPNEELSWNQEYVRRSLEASQINTLFLSRIGDTSLDLPAATVIIQVSSHFGSRRQEAQRLGRILRARKRNEEGFYSRFYTLVTNDTSEVQFSERRRQFLEEDCGYGYQIWKVGDEEGGGWNVVDDVNNTSPENDEVKTDPLTCTIRGAGARPFATEEEERKLISDLEDLKNVVVEEEDESEDNITTANGGTKRKNTTSASANENKKRK